MEVERLKGKYYWDAKRKRHVKDQPKEEVVAKAVRLFYSDLSSSKNDDRHFQSAIKLARRTPEADSLGDDCKNPKKRVRGKDKTPEVREELFQSFIDGRTSLKVRLPRKTFVLQAQRLVEAKSY